MDCRYLADIGREPLNLTGSHPILVRGAFRPGAGRGEPSGYCRFESRSGKRADYEARWTESVLERLNQS